MNPILVSRKPLPLRKGVPDSAGGSFLGGFGILFPVFLYLFEKILAGQVVGTVVALKVKQLVWFPCQIIDPLL